MYNHTPRSETPTFTANNSISLSLPNWGRFYSPGVVFVAFLAFTALLFSMSLLNVNNAAATTVNVEEYGTPEAVVSVAIADPPPFVSPETGEAIPPYTAKLLQGNVEHLPGHDGVNHVSGAISAGQRVSVQVGSPNTTVLGNLTVTGAKGSGFTTAWQCDVNKPLASVNNYVANQTVPNFFAVKTDTDGYVCLYTSGNAEVIFDLYGAANGVTATVPVRKFDTRNGNGKVPGDSAYTYQTGKPNQTIMGNLTVTTPERNGFTAAYPCEEGLPNSSVSNYSTSQTVPNFTAVKADSKGNVCFYTTANAHMLFDEVATSGQATVTSHKPDRLLDTRKTSMAVKGSTTVVKTGKPNTTILGNLTITEPADSGFTTVWNCTDVRPNSSVNNYSTKQTIANFAAAKTNSKGEFCIYTTTNTHLVWDSMGNSTQFTLNTPSRKLDTRDWGKATNDTGSTHWAALANHANQPVRWNPCVGTINVYVNPNNGGAEQVNNIKTAIDKFNSSGAMRLTYAGTTNLIPSSANGNGFNSPPGKNAIVVAFGPPGMSDILPVESGALGMGGNTYLTYQTGPAVAVNGFVIINATLMAQLKLGTGWLVALYMHELGHAVGLGHYSDVKQVMNPVLASPLESWGRGDYHGLHTLGKATGCIVN